MTSLGRSFGAWPPEPSATRMSPFDSTRIWRGILRSVATAVIVNPAGTVGVSPFQHWGFAIFIGGTSVSSIFGGLGFLPVWSSFSPPLPQAERLVAAEIGRAPV